MRMETVGIVGLGFMGRSIASCLLWKGLRVVGLTEPASGYAAALEAIDADVRDLIAHGAAPAELQAAWRSRYAEARDYAGLAGCDFVIECVPEDLPLKRAVLAKVEAAVPDGTPIGTNTSAIPITQVQAACGRPERVVGMHWFAPCHTNRFLEVIRGEQTSAAAADAAMRLGELAGRDAGLVRKDVAGFVVNRLSYAMHREALHLVEQGVADVATIDRIFTSVVGVWGSRMGPFRWMDLSGLPGYATAMARIFPTLSNATDVPPTMRELADSGAAGVRNGRGFYSYTPEEAAAWQADLVEHSWAIQAIREKAAAAVREQRQSRPATETASPGL